MTGWADLLPPGTADATPAVFVALIMFVVPAGANGETLLTWKLVQVGHFFHTVVLLKCNIFC